MINALGLLDYTCSRETKRFVSECIFNLESIDKKILGFENHQSTIDELKTPLFIVEKGFGHNDTSNTEGFRKNNFVGTYLLGPLLVRNPKLLTSICQDIISIKEPNFNYKDFNLDLESKAHDVFLK